MRILVLTNFFPPARPGGYTQWCQEVTDRLAARGHTVGVLTSCHERAKAPADEQGVIRRLHLEGDLAYYRPLQFFLQRTHQHREDLVILEQTVNAFAPDLIFIWGMWALSKALPARAEQLRPGRVVYYLCDYWPAAADMHTTYWQAPAEHWYMRGPKRVLRVLALGMLASDRRPDLQLEHVMCVSGRVRQLLVEAGVPVEHARVIHGGTDIQRFQRTRALRHGAGLLRLLYAGQLVQHKGVHTAIEAMSRLVNMHGVDGATLTLVGSGHPGYEAHLRRLVARERLQGHVTFHTPVPREQMPDLLQQFDVLVLPSIYEEPLARVTQEAMAAGLVVVGTTTGGTPEILRDGETGLTFAPEDAEGLAQQIIRLMRQPELVDRLAQAGRQAVQEKFTLDRMVAEIEAFLVECCAGGAQR